MAYFDLGKCLRCQAPEKSAATHELCADCSVGLELIDHVATAVMSESIEFPDLVETTGGEIRFDSFGTKENPRIQEYPNMGQVPVRILKRPGEYVHGTTKPWVKRLLRYKVDGHKRPAKLSIVQNLWFSKRTQLETQIRYVDRSDDYYIEFHVSDDKGLITWCNEEPLSQHTVDAPRLPKLSLQRWPALSDLTKADFDSMVAPYEHGKPVTFKGVSYFYSPDSTIFVPGFNGDPWVLLPNSQVNPGEN